MTVGLTTGLRPVPGRQQDFQQSLQQSLQHLQHLGGARVHLWQANIAGANTGGIGLTVEYDDLKAFGAWWQKQIQDSPWQSHLQAVAASGATTLVSRVLWLEFGGPQRLQQQSPGGIMQATLFQVSSGKLQDAQQLLRRGGEIRTKHGGQVSQWQAAVAGAGTGQVLAVHQFPGMEAYAESLAKLQQDRDWQAFAADLQGGATLTRLGSSLWSALPVA